MTSRAPEPTVKKRWWVAAFGGAGIWISLLVHLFFFGIAAVIVVQHFQKKHVDFYAAAAPSSPTEVEHKVQLAKRDDVESAPPDLKRITTTDLSPISLPDIPESPKTDDITPTTMSGTGANGSGAGSGMGGGNGTGAGIDVEIPPNSFGAAEGNGFVGTFYDMKQTPDRKPTRMAASGLELTSVMAPNWTKLPATQYALDFLRTFVATWDPSLLDAYYKAPTVLHADQIFVPRFSAAEGPRAFHVEDTVESRRWIVLYKARIIPPKTGTFRFIGFGDDFLIVRVAEKNVLDASWRDDKVVDTANVDADVGVPPLYVKDQPLYCGKWIDMQSGVPLDMDVLIGECPGGDCSFFLLIQEQGVVSAKGDYPVFQLKDVPVPPWDRPQDVPPGFTGKKMVFGVAPPSN